MMKFIVSILVTSVFSFALGLYLPWWSVAISAFVVTLSVPQTPAKSFFSGFLGIFLVWLLLCLLINSSNQHILAVRVASVLPLGGSAALLIFFTAFTGGLVGGMASLTAGFLRVK